MIEKLLKNKSRIALIVVFLILLVVIRVFESALFYDPFLAFFKLDYQNKPLPAYDGCHLFLGILFRYGLNTIISLVLIYLFFKERKLVVFSTWLYLFLFVILISLFFGLLYFDSNPSYLVLFYVRRFLIQPLFLVLFIAAFYYQKKIK